MTAQKIADDELNFVEQTTPIRTSSGVGGHLAWLSRRATHIAINAFLLFHILAATCWCVPIDSPLIPLCRNLIRPYFLRAGLFQSWNMFAPIPKGANTFIEATLIYRDKSRKIWTFPRVEQMNLTKRFFNQA